MCVDVLCCFFVGIRRHTRCALVIGVQTCALPISDYQKLIDEGMDAWTVAFVRAARDEIPSKPRKKWKIQGWADSVNLLRDMAQGMKIGRASCRERVSQYV